MIQLLFEYGLIAMGLTSTLGLFLTLKKEMWNTSRKQRRKMEEIHQRLQDAMQREPFPASIPMAPRAALNINRRVQALRMLRRGEDISHVAAALGVPRREVELLIRVQEMVIVRAAKSGA